MIWSNKIKPEKSITFHCCPFFSSLFTFLFFYCLSHLWKLLQCQILVNFNEIDQMQIVTKNLCEPFCRGQKNTKMCQPKEEYPYHILKWSGSKYPYPILNWGNGTNFDLLAGVGVTYITKFQRHNAFINRKLKLTLFLFWSLNRPFTVRSSNGKFHFFFQNL